MTTGILRHPLLGPIRGKSLSPDLTLYAGLPYATVPHRFARSTTLSSLPALPSLDKGPFDATDFGPESVQPLNATETDARGNQFPHDGFVEQRQSEDCLVLNITTPSSQILANFPAAVGTTSAQPSTSASSSASPSDCTPPSAPLLPVVVFLHGGAFFLGSASRPYYDPLNFLVRAVHTAKPVIFVSINYRLSTLGFLHSPHAGHILPPNNALHDQLRAFEWIHRYIPGFGGDPSRITALGQSAGAMSLALHSVSGNPTPLFRQMVCLSGSPVTMPSKTPDEYHETFLSLARKLDVPDVPAKTAVELADAFARAPIDQIRDLSFVGAPCTSSELLPYGHSSMTMTRKKPASSVAWLKSAIYSSATFDGGVSYNILAPSKKDVARSFVHHVEETMSAGGARDLLELYRVSEQDDDASALEKVCQFESDVGFFLASLAQAQGSPAADKTYLQIFDLKNPFDAGGSLPKNRFPTHTWDVVSLLGCYDDHEALAGEEVRESISGWRDRVLRFVWEDGEPWDAWEEGKGKALRVGEEGLRVQGKEEYLGEQGGRRGKLLELAYREKGEEGCDFLWEGVCRPWLDG